MKKITLLMMLFVASIGMNAQSWDFTTQTDWTAGSGGTLSGTNFSWDIETKPKLTNGSANVDADVNKVFSIIIKNNTEMTEIKLKHRNAEDDSNRYVKFNIDANEDSFKTYYFDLTNTKWGGTQAALDIIITPGGGKTTSASSLEIDKIEFIASIPTIERHDFQFATGGDVEGFKDSNLGDLGAVVSGGQLTLDLTKADSYPNIVQLDYHVVAEGFPTLEVSLKNLSPEDDTMTLILDDGTTYSTTISTSDTDFNTYKVILDTAATWMGEQSAYKIRFGDASRPNPKKPDNYGVSSGQGSVVIDYITFTSETLSNDEITKGDTQLSIYPNPVRNTLSVKSSAKINSLQIYNVTGQEVLRSSEATINTSSLTKGVYILKVSQEGGAISTKRFIKE